MQKNYYLTIDTETANGLDCPLVYDIGFAVFDKKGHIYEQYSFVVSEVFNEMSDLMQTAYYANKIPQYKKDIAEGKRVVTSFFKVRAKIFELCKKYHIKAIIAHNMRFDLNACNTTYRYLTKSKYRYFFPRSVKIWDSLSMARTTIGKQTTYRMWCKENGFTTKNGQPKLTAEILYRFISRDKDFKEAHTALEDVLIEILIFLKCVSQRKKMQYTYWKTA